MTILFDSIFGHGRMIIFKLVEWVGIKKEQLKKTHEGYACAFPMPAVSTRHDVPIE